MYTCMCNWVTTLYSRKKCIGEITINYNFKKKKIKNKINKKNKIMPFVATWMKLETLILSEVSHKEKDKYHMISLISGI